MKISPIIQGKVALCLSADAITYGTTPTVLAKAIVETIVSEGLLHETLCGVDLEEFATRRPGRKKGTGSFEFEGRLRSITFISEHTGVPANVIRDRLRRGWPMEKAAWAPKQAKGFPKKRVDA